jgi:ubiquinone/menaquinone biosynthesis C-methylase UbiE
MPKELMYNKFAKYYDKIYEELEYDKDVEFLEWLIQNHKQTDGNRLLDVACGTGNHAQYFVNNYSVLGIDKSEDMLRIAREKAKNAEFKLDNMQTFDLDEHFDVVICMFSSIGYNTTYADLETTLRNFHRHLHPGGVLIFDTWFHKKGWIEGFMNINTVIEDNLQVARISQSRSKGDVGNFNMVFVIKDRGEIDFEIDQHKLLIIDIDKVKDLMELVGFTTEVYAGSTHELWSKKTRERPYFCGVKQ